MANKGKTILILGNGFDLAHGLPTKYSHFLEFCRCIERIWSFGIDNDAQTIARFKETWIDKWVTDESIKDAVVTAFENRKITLNSEGKKEIISDNKELTEIHDLLDGNVWYYYFLGLYNDNSLKGENWIDFEFEIRLIIKEVDTHSASLKDYWNVVIQDSINSASDDLGELKFALFGKQMESDKCKQKRGWVLDDKITVKDFREKAFEDLERLTRALEIYLSAFVEKIQTGIRISVIDCLTPDYVINFNYTNTYERIYGKGKVYHIHGKADINHSIEDNNMVLGIDEYWIGEDQDEKTNFTIFKKFAQRIQKHTGNDSYRYMEEIQKQFKAKKDTWSGNVDMTKTHSDGISEVYIFGHSLDITDKDILSSFIGDDATSVIVYCMDKGTEGELIANTIKLITEKRLLEKVNHVPPKLKYVIPPKEQ